MLSRINKYVLANKEKEATIISNIWAKKDPIDIII